LFKATFELGSVVDKKMGAPKGINFRSIATDLADEIGTPRAPIGPGKP